MRVRILVVGESGSMNLIVGVGKTCLVHLLSTSKAIDTSPQRTLGCNMQVKLLEFANEECCIEFLDIGGYCKNSRSRDIFYKNFDAVLLVYNSNSAATYQLLWKWIGECFNASQDLQTPLKPKLYSGDFDVEKSTPSPASIPIMVIGTHADSHRIKTDCIIAKEYKAHSIILSTKKQLDSQFQGIFNEFYSQILASNNSNHESLFKRKSNFSY